jgi:hypothetical protein
MKIYQNKEKPWKNIYTMVNNYEKSVFFHLKPVPNNTWLKRPRFFAHINLFIVSFWRDNSNLRFGIGFGKKQFSINFHR